MTLTGTFRIIEIDGAPAAGGFQLALDDEGRIHGRVVNRFSGAAVQSDGAVQVGPLAATRMAGPPEVMTQEDAVFRILSGTVAVAEDDGGVLLTGEGGTLRLTRAEADETL